MSRMDEIRDMYIEIHRAHERGQRTALLIITKVQGSAYRQPGAKMMMIEDGQTLGTLSGGCLESDLFGWTEKAISTQTPITCKYDLSENDLWGLGIGCKGALEILILPVDPTDNFWRFFSNIILNYSYSYS
jgi:xanthine dehydrogenase accessory factor